MSVLMQPFLSGAFMLACVAIALFFVQYWKRTRDRLFAVLALAFALLALERWVLAFVPPWQEGRHWIFLARLLAFSLIIAGIIDKNRPRRHRARHRPEETDDGEDIEHGEVSPRATA